MREHRRARAAVQLFDMDFRHVESAFKTSGATRSRKSRSRISSAKLGASAVVDMGGSLHLGLAYTNERKVPS